jgi:hypothetical protein
LNSEIDLKMKERKVKQVLLSGRYLQAVENELRGCGG